jgi:ankyrin repeat protein
MAFVARICALVLVWMSICHAHTLTDVAVCLASGDLSRLHTILGADPSLLNARHASTGQTPLMMATLQGKTDAVKALLQMDGVDVTIGEKDGYTPMHGAGFQVYIVLSIQYFF